MIGTSRYYTLLAGKPALTSSEFKPPLIHKPNIRQPLNADHNGCWKDAGLLC